jgi:hypothetical protein
MPGVHRRFLTPQLGDMMVRSDEICASDASPIGYVIRKDVVWLHLCLENLSTIFQFVLSLYSVRAVVFTSIMLRRAH